MARGRSLINAVSVGLGAAVAGAEKLGPGLTHVELTRAERGEDAPSGSLEELLGEARNGPLREADIANRYSTAVIQGALGAKLIARTSGGLLELMPRGEQVLEERAAK